MKNLIIFLFLLISVSFSASAYANGAYSPLWSVDEIYEMGEVLDASRFDYQGGMSVRFQKGSDLVLSQKSQCEVVSYQKIIDDFKAVIENHRQVFFDDEFDFDYALLLVEEKLAHYYEIKACGNDYYSRSGDYLLSYKLL